jgi:uncharacterized membrane protein
MPLKERFLQVFLYEIVALAVVSPLYSHFSGKSFESSLGLLVMFSVIAVTWVFCYNWLFERLAGCRSRTQPRRVLHAIGLEATMTAMTLPLAMAWMGFDWLTALVGSASLTATYCLYGYLFFWVYDAGKAKLDSLKGVGEYEVCIGE